MKFKYFIKNLDLNTGSAVENYDGSPQMWPVKLYILQICINMFEWLYQQVHHSCINKFISIIPSVSIHLSSNNNQMF